VGLGLPEKAMKKIFTYPVANLIAKLDSAAKAD
jgi:hypothetical protein